VYEVYLTDRNLSWDEGEQLFFDAAAWARAHCVSYQGHHVQDVSDFSYIYDNVTQYLFADEQDAVLFTLKWQQS
jgi:hypothetical protein